jgi:hypothetical protein
MKLDLYLKTVLTVIALALLWIGFTLNTKVVHAAGPTPVVITGIQFPNGTATLPVGIAATGWTQEGTWMRDPLPVSVSNQKLTVTIAKDQPSKPPNK